MAVLLQCVQLSKEYENRMILENIDLQIKEGERVGIVGPNGAGKTTLANMIVGKIEPTSGQLLWQRPGISVGYMQQYTDCTGLKETLSGGEKTKEVLKKILHSYNQVLLLDEPTNHLDSEGVKWLVKQIKAFKGTVIIISHDRYFLDQCVTRILEIDKKQVTSYNGNYSWYRSEKSRLFAIEMHQYVEQEKLKERIGNQIDTLRAWSGKAHKGAGKKAEERTGTRITKSFYRSKAKCMDKTIKSRIKRLEKIEVSGMEKPEEESKVLFQLEEAKKVGKVIVEAKDLKKSYGNRILFSHTSFYIKRGEKIGIYGPNGCGKSTLMKAMMNEIDSDGDLRIHSARRIGYLSQDVDELDKESTVIGLFNLASRQMEGEVRTQLYQMGFDRESLMKKVGVLSLGERMKLKLLLMIREGCEVLLLDEPTNHIDLHVREQLEETLLQYTGTIILVTHDRYMLERLCDKLLVFEEKRISRYEYGLGEYERRKIEQKAYKKERKHKEDYLLLENKIAYVIGQLSMLEAGTDAYKALDEEYRLLMDRRKCSMKKGS